MSRNLTLRQLRAFAAVAEQGSFTAAAARLHLTQSALSVLVRELERELGARLFDRHTRRVLLTEAGRELLPYATRVLADLEQAASSVAGLSDKSRGWLRLAMPQLMASTLGARAIAAFHRQHPGIAIELHDTPPDQLVGEMYCLIMGLLHDVRFLRDPQAAQRTEASWARLVKSYLPSPA